MQESKDGEREAWEREQQRNQKLECDDKEQELLWKHQWKSNKTKGIHYKENTVMALRSSLLTYRVVYVDDVVGERPGSGPVLQLQVSGH